MSGQTCCPSIQGRSCDSSQQQIRKPSEPTAVEQFFLWTLMQHFKLFLCYQVQPNCNYKLSHESGHDTDVFETCLSPKRLWRLQLQVFLPKKIMFLTCRGKSLSSLTSILHIFYIQLSNQVNGDWIKSNCLIYCRLNYNDHYYSVCLILTFRDLLNFSCLKKGKSIYSFLSCFSMSIQGL